MLSSTDQTSESWPRYSHAMHTNYCTLYQHILQPRSQALSCIYSRIVIQLNMYVKIITSSGFKSTILTDFVQARTASGSVSLWPMLEISRKYTYLPEVVVSTAGSSTTRAARHKMGKKIGAEFMTSVSYRPEVIKWSKHSINEQSRSIKTRLTLWFIVTR